MKKEFEKLSAALYSMSKPEIDHKMKDKIRNAVMNDIKSNIAAYPGAVKRLQLTIRTLAAAVRPSAVFAAEVKEKVFAYIERKSAGPSFFRRFVWNMEKVMASLLLVTIISGICVVYVADIPVTKAAKRTYISDVSGRVDIIRGPVALSAYIGMELEEGDTVVTEDSGAAEIRYCDDSITRISPQTRLKLRKLFIDSENITKTLVEVELESGRVWSQVINIIGTESSFNVKTDEVKAIVVNKASFDVKSINNTQKTEVSVFANKVKVAMPKQSEEKDKILLEGYSIEVNKEYSKEKKIVITPKISQNEEWVKDNKVKDKKYVEKVTEELKTTQKEQAGVLPDNPLYTAKKINEGTKLLVTSNPEEKIKLQIDIAKKRLIEANALFSEGKTDQAESVLNEFRFAVKDMAPSIIASEELKRYAEMQFAEESKKLAVILPDNPLYPSKEALREAKEKLTTTPEEQKVVALNHASEKINEARDLVTENKSDMAADTLLNVKDNIKTGIGTSQDAASTLADAKVLTGTIQEQETQTNFSTTRRLNKIAQETETALNTELMQAVVTETKTSSDTAAADIDEIILTSEVTQIKLIQNSGEADIAVIIPSEQAEQE
ncbi:FecR domain-containing protein [Candidatus Peregrinibacteria bacterium]|nr:FecR domain-containing protein [Candidatus Peregrinibacteria bacterium]